jgi:hypothetical protein
LPVTVRILKQLSGQVIPAFGRGACPFFFTVAMSEINKSFHSSVFMLSHPSFSPGPPVKFDGPKLSRIMGVYDIRLCLGVLCLKSQIPSTKLQINIKFQYSMTKTFQDDSLFGFSNFGHWKLFDICDLIFVISELPIKQIPSEDKPKPGSLGQDSLPSIPKFPVGRESG